MKILQAQTVVSPSPEETFKAVIEACQLAVDKQADLLALPEMFCCPYDTASFPRYAESEGGEIWQKCAELAKKYNIYISAGSMPEKDEAGQVFNTAYVFNRQGKQIAKHRKVHLFDIDVKGGQYFKESDTLTAGRDITVFDTEFGKVGLCICYDFRFPELARLMVLQGAKVILVPASFNMTTGPLHWELIFRAQAMFNQCYTIGTATACNMADSYHSWGHSIAVDPWGKVMAQLDEKVGYQLVDVDLSDVEAVRQQLPLIKHRRTDLYKLE